MDGSAWASNFSSLCCENERSLKVRNRYNKLLAPDYLLIVVCGRSRDLGVNTLTFMSVEEQPSSKHSGGDNTGYLAF